MKNEKKQLEKKNYQSSFILVGKAKLNDFTFQLNEKSKESDWLYNRLNIGIDCGEKYGTVYAELMGGYGTEREDNFIYVHGKDDKGKDDYSNQFTVAWEDRFSEDVLSEVGDNSFITVGLEKTKEDKTFYKKFLSAYDAIAYVKEHLVEGMIVNVKGKLKYQVYMDNTIVKKEITSIVLSSATEDKFHANFMQTIELDRNSLGKIDKDKNIVPIYAKVLEYFKTWNNKEVKQIIPLAKTFEYELPEDTSKCESVLNYLFKVKTGITEITFEGNFVEAGATKKITINDLTDDLKNLIKIGVFTEEQALERCADNGGKEHKMILTLPVIKKVGNEDEEKIPVIQKFEKKYSEEDFQLECLKKDTSDKDDDDDDDGLTTNPNWLDNLN